MVLHEVHDLCLPLRKFPGLELTLRLKLLW
jgi:hypothetical protein